MGNDSGIRVRLTDFYPAGFALPVLGMALSLLLSGCTHGDQKGTLQANTKVGDAAVNSFNPLTDSSNTATNTATDYTNVATDAGVDQTNANLRLVDLAKLQTKQLVLPPAESNLLDAINDGNTADFSSFPEDQRQVDAEWIHWVCTDPAARTKVTASGISIKAARIYGQFNLADTKFPFLLEFLNCNFGDDINLRHAQIHELDLDGSKTRQIIADGLNVERGVSLGKGFVSKGGVNLWHAEIGAYFDCSSGRFLNLGGNALNAEALQVKGTVFLNDDFKAEGQVRFLGARIDGDLQCMGGQITGKGTITLEATSADIKGDVRLDGRFTTDGQLNFYGATINGSLNCDAATIQNGGGIVLNAKSLQVNGDLLLDDNFSADGRVDLNGAKIGGFLDCSNGKFRNPGDYAIAAQGAKVDGSVYLSGNFEGNGEVTFYGAKLGGDLDCGDGHFSNEGGMALTAEGVDVKGDMFLNHTFKAGGQVSLTNAIVGRDLRCEGGQFINPTGLSLAAHGLLVGHDLYLTDGFISSGMLDISDAVIGGNIDCEKGSFLTDVTSYPSDENSGIAIKGYGLKVEHCLWMRRGFKVKGSVELISARIGRYFEWTSISSPDDVTLDLESVTVGTLRDEQASWPRKEKLILNGFNYDTIETHSLYNAGIRTEWLRLQPAGNFFPQPYEELAAEFKKEGLEQDAKKILYAKNEDQLSQTKVSLWWVLHWLFGRVLGYGYYPEWAVYYSIGFIVLGWLIFRRGDRRGLIKRVKDGEFVNATDGRKVEKFYPFIYSLQTFIPLVSFDLDKSYRPDPDDTSRLGRLLRFYRGVHIVMGYVFTALLGAALAGLIKG